MNLKDLHEVIQAAMGWLDYHLWEFTANERKFGVPQPDDTAWGKCIADASTASLATVLSSGVPEFSYAYDFGDNWQHRIIVESVKLVEVGMRYPQFRGGERRCPPEDCGGIPGYYDFLKTITGRQARNVKPRSTGTVVPTTPTILMNDKLPSP